MKNALIVSLSLLIAHPGSGQTVTDIDGNVYNTVTIGGQVWMKENLVTSHYQDGTLIPHIANNTTWFNLISSGARCYFFNDSATMAGNYGALYNWNAVTNPLNVCPTGWHVPSDGEWNSMTQFLDPTVDPNFQGTTGTGTDIGNQLKEIGMTYWDVGNGGTNSSGFSARGAGYRKSAGTFEYLNSFTYFWTSTYGQQSKAWIRSINFNDPTISRFILDRNYGASIRCVQDISTAVPEENGTATLQCFPNPATDQVLITCSGIGTVQLTIYDALGNEVMRNDAFTAGRSLDISALPNGLYLLHVRNGSSVSIGRLVKE